MKVNIKEIIKNKEVISYNIPEENCLYAVDVIGEPDTKKELTLFFATNTNDLKWYSYKTNRSIFINKISKVKKKWIFVIENKKLLANKDNYYILVNSVNSYIDNLANEVLKKNDYKVIAITGSVGKTTLSRLLTSVIDDSQLIDVRRLTPLNVADFIFNKLKPTTKFIIAEVGLYYSGQINQLVNLLCPEIGIITNIYDMHIGWNNIKNRSDLLYEKMNLLKSSKIRIVSKELFVEYASSHNFIQNNIIYNNLDYTSFVSSCSNLPKTKVSLNIVEIADIILNKYVNDVSDNRIYENLLRNDTLFRLHKYEYAATEIFVDSHSSIAGYFQALSCHWYPSSILIILSLHFPIEENIENNIRLIKETFSSFDKVFINNKLLRYFGLLDKIRTRYIAENQFISVIKNEKVVFIHDPEEVRNSRVNTKNWKILTNNI